MIMVSHSIDNFCVIFFSNVISHLNSGYDPRVKRVIFTSGWRVSWGFSDEKLLYGVMVFQ